MAVRSRIAYLFCYNVLMFLLWLRTLALLLSNSPDLGLISIIRSSPPRSFFRQEHLETIYSVVSPPALLAQKLTWVEVVHAALGMAGSSVSAAFIQALGRSAVLLVLLDLSTSARQSWPALTLLFAAACSEVVRYAFYAVTLVASTCPRWLTTARYSLFLLCYPLGILSEWLLYAIAMPELDASGIARITLPNTWNFAFDYALWNRAVMLAYLYFGPSMFLYMLRQRKRKLS